VRITQTITKGMGLWTLLQFASFSALSTDLISAQLAASCTGCHSPSITSFLSSKNSIIPNLTGMPSAHIVKVMQEYQKGERQATLMHQISKGYTEEEISQIAQFFSTLNPATPFKKGIAP